MRYDNYNNFNSDRKKIYVNIINNLYAFMLVAATNMSRDYRYDLRVSKIYYIALFVI
jgi:hypothetical protein